MDLRNACLVLKTSDLVANATNSVGTLNLNKNDMTWVNINLRTVLGDLYDLYDNFNLSLYYIASDASGTISGATDRACTIYMGGLPFSNQTYDVKNNCNGTDVVLSPFLFLSAASVQQHYFSSNYITFSKNQELVDISIKYSKIQTDTLYTGAQVYPNMIFVLHIFGIPKEINQSSRLRLY
jgi:hypothetical protein